MDNCVHHVLPLQSTALPTELRRGTIHASTVNRTQGLQIFSLTLSQLSYRGVPIQGLEPWYPAWKASMLTTYIISELLFFAAHKFQKIIHNPKQLYRKYSINLLPSLMLLIVTFYQSIMVLRRSQLYFHFTRCLACFVYQLWMTEDKQNDS